MKLLASEKADSEVTGHVILLFITILGVSVILLYGVPAILNLEDMVKARNAEQTFAVQDSRASRAVLGESPLQITNINLGGGSPSVVPNSSQNPSYMAVKSLNNTFNVTLPMGKVIYQLDDNRTVAYEDGGVWSKYPSGGSVMLSPPEFHYNGVTLTLPVFNISGNASVGGKGTAAVSFNRNAPIVRFPNTTCANCNAYMTNPVNYTMNGKVYVNITSDYYDAWADYANQTINYARVVAIDSKNKTVSIELRVVPNTLGQSTPIPVSLDFKGLDPSDTTPLDNFSFIIYKNGQNFNSFNWDIRAKSGNKKLIYHITANNSYASIKIGYQHDNQGYIDPAEMWLGNGIFPVQGDYIDVDLLNRSINLTYQSPAPANIGSTNGNCYPDKIDSGDFNNTGFSWGSASLTNKSLYDITQHYFELLAQEGDSVSFGQCSPSYPQVGNNAPDPARSTVLLNYTATGALTYLHITDNKADVSIS